MHTLTLQHVRTTFGPSCFLLSRNVTQGSKVELKIKRPGLWGAEEHRYTLERRNLSRYLSLISSSTHASIIYVLPLLYSFVSPNLHHASGIQVPALHGPPLLPEYPTLHQQFVTAMLFRGESENGMQSVQGPLPVLDLSLPDSHPVRSLACPIEIFCASVIASDTHRKLSPHRKDYHVVICITKFKTKDTS